MSLEDFVISVVHIPLIGDEEGEEKEEDYKLRVAWNFYELCKFYSAVSHEVKKPNVRLLSDLRTFLAHHGKFGWNRWLGEKIQESAEPKTAEDYKSETIWTPDKDEERQAEDSGDVMNWDRINKNGEEKNICVHLYKYYKLTDHALNYRLNAKEISGIVFADTYNPEVSGKILRVTANFVKLIIAGGINSTGDIYYKHKRIAHFPE